MPYIPTITYNYGQVGFELPYDELGVSKNRGTPKSSILIGFSIINHPFCGVKSPYFWFNTQLPYD